MNLDYNEEKICHFIDRAKHFFKKKNLFGGNCGVFAYSLVDCLNKNLGINAKLGIIYNDRCEEQKKLRDVIELETEIYHVFIEYKDKKFDGEGVIDDQYLIDFAKVEYGDDNPGYFADISIDEKDALILVLSETNWSINKEKFDIFFKDEFEKINNKNLKFVV